MSWLLLQAPQQDNFNSITKYNKENVFAISVSVVRITPLQLIKSKQTVLITTTVVWISDLNYDRVFSMLFLHLLITHSISQHLKICEEIPCYILYFHLFPLCLAM